MALTTVLRTNVLHCDLSVYFIPTLLVNKVEYIATNFQKMIKVLQTYRKIFRQVLQVMFKPAAVQLLS